ncbi:transketolase family protein [Paenibacillus pini]|uniref:Transketolase n=1 Tax=Paenibacillus pini JCM 16418 TaxID=1236976 RepID=W7YL39_9BACL|nr:transketolase C-terminal domain-containing protein [Paenibacillus pini]GAF09237.1 transketolase [Paenibacillus pini JCM 16418]
MLVKYADSFTEYMKTVIKIATDNEKTVVIDCDLGKSFKTSLFRSKFPERSFNFGVAEQNAFSAAAGLASQGFNPIVQTFSVFASTRALDQFRNSICYTNQNVLVVGAKSSISDPSAGATHQSIDDVGILSSIPNLQIYSPASIVDLIELTEMLAHVSGPKYMRIENTIVDEISIDPTFKSESLDFYANRNQYKVLIISTGSFVETSINVMGILENNYGIPTAVINLKRLKPLDINVLERFISHELNLIVVEPLNTTNGLGAQISKMLFESSIYHYITNFTNIGFHDIFTQSGDMSSLLELYQLDERAILRTILKSLGEY